MNERKHKFFLNNNISYPDIPYPIPRRVIKERRSHCKTVDKIKKCSDIFVDVMKHSGGVLGNNVIFGVGDSIIVGLPYAWMGSSVDVFGAYSYGKERMLGTIGKVELNFRHSKVNNGLIVPQPKEHDRVMDEGGAIWGGIFREPTPSEIGSSQFSTRSNPIKNFYTGTSITKGMITGIFL